MSDDFENKINDAFYQEPISPLDTQVMLNRILLLEWRDLSSAQKIESDLYICLQHYPDKVEYLILMCFVQLILQKVERANALALKIWETGGNLDIPFKLLYTHILSILNMKEMAMQMVASLSDDDIQNMEENLFAPLINFAFAHGGKDILQFVAAYASQDVFEILKNFILFCDNQDYWKIFAAFQNIIFEKSAHNLLDFDVRLEMENNFCVVNFYLFVAQNASALQTEINASLEDYCIKRGLTRAENFYINVLPVFQHQPLANILLPVL